MRLKGAVRNVRTRVPLDDLWGKTDKHKSEVCFLRLNLSFRDVMAISRDGMFTESIHVRLI